MKMLRGLPILFCTLAIGQVQYPGQYPPGQYPGGPSPIPRIPGQTGPQTGPTGRPRPSQTPPPSTGRGRRPASDAALLTTTTGILRRVAANQLVIQSGDHRVIWYRLAGQIKVEKDGKDANLSDFALGDFLSVDSTGTDDGVLTAVSVSWKKAATAEDRADASKNWDLPRLESTARAPAVSSASSPAREPGDDRPVLRRNDPKSDQPKEVAVASGQGNAPDNEPPPTVMRPPDPTPDADDPGPPSLRRGAPAPRRPTANSTQEPVAAAATVIREAAPEQEDPVIAKAREAAASYSETLPNYLVQQMTTRYQSDHPKSGWTALDVVTADLTYQDGSESYKNIKVGNKSVNKAMDEIEGTHSTGEFSTLLEQLLGTYAAKFRALGPETIRNRSALVYAFEVPRELSRWRIEAPSQLYYPALKGSIWIDKETSRVLRLEQQGRAMPALFPFDTIETSADYDFIRLGTSGPYLLPVEAEVLSCQRGTSLCSRNKIEFRNYRKFGAQSDVSFGDVR